MRMRTTIVMLVTFGVGAGVGMWVEGRRGVEAQAPNTGAFAAVPGAVGSQDLTGPYEVVKGWPADISTLPGNEKWTYGAGQSVYAESPNRVFILQLGELPNIPRPIIAAKSVGNFRSNAMNVLTQAFAE